MKITVSLSHRTCTVFFSGVCVFGGGAGHITADDWCVCERGVSENVMIGLRRVHFYRLPTRGR